MTEICEKCGGEKLMYDYPWCSHCDKPGCETLEYLNLIKCLDYLEVRRPGIKGRLWALFGDMGHVRNDTYTYIALVDTWVTDAPREIPEDLKFFREIFDIEEGAYFEVSW